MKAEIKKRWTDALRGTDYKQGKDMLIDPEGCMCCLAVLCDITKDETKGEWTEDGEFEYGESSSSEGLPSFVMDHVGIDTNLGYMDRWYAGKSKKGEKGKMYETLAELNDSGLSFKQIANIIDKNF